MFSARVSAGGSAAFKYIVGAISSTVSENPKIE